MKIRYLNIILTVISILLLSIALHLIHLKAILTAFNQNNQIIINSNNQVINSSRRLENSLSDFKKQIETLGDKFLKK
jgi:hypothetical protein